MDKIKILAIGDVVGEPGRRACKVLIPRIKEKEKIDFIVANGENMAGGSGVTEKTANELFDSGIDVITAGDHVFNKRESYDLLEREKRLLRPANFPPSAVGSGSVVVKASSGVKVGVINLVGRVFLKTVECPFSVAQREIEKIKKETNVIVVDLHAEATSEKVALGWFLDGKVSLLCGTHTHIQTADEAVLPEGTAYITDLGMTGPHRSVLGRDIKAVLERFITQMPIRFEMAKDDVMLCAVIIEIDPKTGRAKSIRRLQEKINV